MSREKEQLGALHARLLGLDIARLLAMTMVAAQHILSICDIDSPPVFFHLDLGQFGVAVFFSISGYLALQSRQTNVRSWLAKRFSRIYVPYWIALTGTLLANHYVNYKSAFPSLIIAEYAGVAGWTNRGELIGVHFWFVSLLLFCYLLAAIMRAFPKSLPVLLSGAVVWLWFDQSYAGHTLSFLTGASFGKFGKLPPLIVVLTVMLCAILLTLTVHIGFAGIVVGAMTVGIVLIPVSIGCRAAHKLTCASENSYNFYLVHGPVYLAVAYFVSGSFLVVSCLGTVIAIVSSSVLRWMDTVVRQSFAAIRKT